MGVFSKLFGRKTEDKKVGGMEDYMTLVRVYFQAALASQLGITNLAMLPDLRAFKTTFRVPTQNNKLGLGSRTLSFISSFVLMIFQRLDYKMHVKINEDEIQRRVMTMCIGNASGYGQTPNAVPYNGLLDVSVVYHPQITQLFEGFYLFVRGKFLNHRSVHPYRTREVEVKEASHALIGVDGRLMNTPKGSYKITVEQEVINFLIPA